MSTKNHAHLRFVSPFVLVAMLAACGGEDDGGIAIPDAPSGGGQTTTFNWTIRRQGATTTCAAVGATEIDVVATAENGLPTNHTFQCILNPGTLGLAPGRWAITATLRDGQNQQTLASVPAQALTVPASGTVPTVQLGFNL
ncbi:MAG: hypothetical protein JWP01_520 [Myxococcales bacterium]|nr:hypothetical protein [Myxococcales bacterium]